MSFDSTAASARSSKLPSFLLVLSAISCTVVRAGLGCTMTLDWVFVFLVYFSFWQTMKRSESGGNRRKEVGNGKFGYIY